MLKGESGRQRMLTVLRKFIEAGGHELQFNVTDNGVLEKAIAEPEKYADLLVRVSGFSGYFTRLSPGVQKDILHRNIHAS
jgi:formate C-acetyltransferase